MPHIPKGTTHELTLPPFEEELALALQPQKDYDSTKWLYVPCTYAEYREKAAYLHRNQSEHRAPGGTGQHAQERRTSGTIRRL